MRYEKFIIERYRAIRSPIEIDFKSRSLLPIIGVNECGKSTILQAIFAFDYNNDESNRGQHLVDVTDIYDQSDHEPRVSAEVSITKSELIRTIEENISFGEDSVLARFLPRLQRKKTFPGRLSITRYLREGHRRYTLSLDGLPDRDSQHSVAEAIVSGLPYILYFDDFQGSVDEKVEILEDNKSEWLRILHVLFKRTNPSYSIYDIPGKEERQRKSIISKVQKHLDKTLTKEWKNFRLDDTDSLRVNLEFFKEGDEESPRYFIKFEIVETDANGDDHFFFIRNRSKGFYWFFNFVLKLEYNPKVISDTDPMTIYLLDEPGSYLHAAAQEKLCKKLKSISESNKVIYCTHSHHLLNPELIPLSLIHISEKTRDGDIRLIPLHEYSGSITEKRLATQPIYDALQLRAYPATKANTPIVIVEGIIDYYLFTMFSDSEQVQFLPSVGAQSIKYYVSLMIASGQDYRALWDKDTDGKRELAKATEHFGEREAHKTFFTLELPGGVRARKVIVQNLVDGADLRSFREELQVSTECSFDKTITELFYSPERASILDEIGATSSENFEHNLNRMGIGVSS